MIAESSSDNDSTKSFDPKKLKKVNIKKDSAELTSMDIVSKNGYLFKQIKHNDPSKKSKKIIQSRKHYCRHKYF